MKDGEKTGNKLSPFLEESDMVMELNTIAVILMECFALVYFLMVFLSKRYARSLSSLKKNLRKEGYGTWSFNFLFPAKRVITPSTLLWITVSIAAFTIAFVLMIGFIFAGYVVIISLIGLEILLDTEAFEAYRYCWAIQKVQRKESSQLNRGDRKYLDVVKETLEMSTIRFTIAGVIFAVAGPFVPQFLNNAIYSFVLYISPGFQATEALSFLGIFVVLLLFIIPLVLLKKLVSKISEKLLPKIGEKFKGD